MGRIEETAKPILIPLIAGRSGEVNPDMQRILATWAVKTAMTSEHVNRKQAVITQPERTWLKDNLIPPLGWYVWIAPYSGTNWRDLAIYQHMGKLEIPAIGDKTAAMHHLHFTILGLGHLMFLVFASNWERIWDILDRMWTGAPVTRIWPPSTDSIPWPAPYVLSDFEAEYLTTFLARVLDQPVQP
jgi:hypothetical protein